MTPDSHYEIRVLGSLDPRWAGWFEGPQVTDDGSQTVLCGPVADQAALHGLLGLRPRARPDLSTPARPRFTTAAPAWAQPAQQREEEIMHPAILQQPAAEHFQQMLADANDERRAHQASRLASAELNSIVAAEGVDLAFWSTVAGDPLAHDSDTRHDPEMAGYGLKMVPGGPGTGCGGPGREPGLAFGALAQANRRRPSPPAHSRPLIQGFSPKGRRR